jgi:plastocyanin
MIVAVTARTLLTPAVVAAAALAVLFGGAPAGAQEPATFASVVAVDNAFVAEDGGPPDVTIAAGGHVNFTYPTGASRHNVVFPDRRPTDCGISEGPEGTTAALPAAPSPPGWEGGCDFDVAGTYAFVCGLHRSMTGSVTVVQTGASPPPPPDRDVELPVGPDAESTAGDLTVALRQRGYGVRGSVLVARGSARLVAQAFARRKALFAGSRSTREVAVGRQFLPSVGGARATFAAPLNRTARRALRRNGRLLVKLRLTITPAEGTPFTAARTVILRPPAR